MQTNEEEVRATFLYHHEFVNHSIGAGSAFDTWLEDVRDTARQAGWDAAMSAEADNA